MSTSLMTTRRFAPLFWCQALTTFDDKFLKQALVFVLLCAVYIQLSTTHDEEEEH